MQNEMFKTKPFAHQEAALKKARGRDVFAYLMEQGTGKTWAAINEAAQMWGDGTINGVFVVAPNGVHTNWTLRELPTHMPEWVRWRAVAWRATANKKQQAEIDSITEGTDSSELRIFAMNWEALQTKRGTDMAISFCRSCTKLLIIGDESQKMKNVDTARHKNMMILRKFSKARRIMSGSAILGNPFDAFGQFMWLDDTILRTTSFFAFKAEYAEMLPPDHPLVRDIKERTRSRGTPQLVATNRDGTKKYKNLDKLARLIESHSFRVLKSECLDLPAKVYTQSFFDLTSDQATAYRKMKDEARVVTEDDKQTPVKKLASIMKLSQITSGFVISPISGDTISFHAKGKNPKLQLLEERITDSLELGNSIIIWARFKEELRHIAALCEENEWPLVQYHGDTPRDERIAAIDTFQAGGVRIFLAQQQAGATGITLTAANHVIYYSNTYAAEDRWQSEDRAHRIGQTRSVLYEDRRCAQAEKGRGGCDTWGQGPAS